MVTHAACEIGAIGNVANTFTTIGSQVRLAQGTGAWLVYQMGASIVPQLATPGEKYGGFMRLDPAESDDWKPVPTPTVVPTPVTGSSLGTTSATPWGIPTTLWPVSFMAAKGTNVNIQAAETISNAAAQVAIGYFFYGTSIPDHALNPWLAPIQKMRTILGTVAATAETSIGEVQVGTNDRRIAWIGEMGAVDGTIVADEESLWRLRLRSDDTPLSDFRFPPSTIYYPPDATPDTAGMGLPQLWPVDIPIRTESTLEVLADHQISTNVQHTVFIGTDNKGPGVPD